MDFEKRREIIGRNIYDLRTNYNNPNTNYTGLNQKELADMLGLSSNNGYKTISSWENGLSVPPLEKLYMLCDIFKCELSFLTGDMPCTTQEKSDIHNKTGLSESAIDSLMDNTDSTDHQKEYEKMVIRSVANILLSSDAGHDFIKHISNYLISDSDMVSTLDMMDAMSNDPMRFEKLVELVNTHNLIKTQKGLERLKNEYDSNPVQWYKIDLM